MFSLRHLHLAAAAAFVLAWSPSAQANTVDRISSIDRKKSSITIFLGPSQSETYRVTKDTRVLINGKPASFRHLNTHMEATVSHASGSNVADLINAHRLVHSHRHAHYRF